MTSPIPQFLDVDAVASCLKEGQVVAMPTDTLPGLACQPEHADKIWSLKQRPADKPLILMAATASELLREAQAPCWQDAQRLSDQYWPGALTLVLPAHGSGLLQYLNPGGSSVGLRVPNCALTLQLLAASGPLATSSANRSGEPSALSAAEVAKTFPDLPLLGPAQWPNPSGLASTVLSWQGPGQWRILRAGAVIPEGVDEQCCC